MENRLSVERIGRKNEKKKQTERNKLGEKRVKGGKKMGNLRKPENDRTLK